MKIYAIYDTIARDTQFIMHMHNDQVATRQFADMLQHQQFQNHSDDFHLIALGEMDPHKPNINNETSDLYPELVITGEKINRDRALAAKRAAKENAE